MTAASLWWAFTLFASGAQTVRNVMQRDLIGALGAVGAAQVRFLFGVPFAFVFLAGMLIATGEPLPAVPGPVFVWALIGAISQIVATSLMLAAMRERSFVVVTAAMKTEAMWAMSAVIWTVLLLLLLYAFVQERRGVLR